MLSGRLATVSLAREPRYTGTGLVRSYFSVPLPLGGGPSPRGNGASVATSPCAAAARSNESEAGVDTPVSADTPHRAATSPPGDHDMERGVAATRDGESPTGMASRSCGPPAPPVVLMVDSEDEPFLEAAVVVESSQVQRGGPPPVGSQPQEAVAVETAPPLGGVPSPAEVSATTQPHGIVADETPPQLGGAPSPGEAGPDQGTAQLAGAEGPASSLASPTPIPTRDSPRPHAAPHRRRDVVPRSRG